MGSHGQPTGVAIGMPVPSNLASHGQPTSRANGLAGPSHLSSYGQPAGRAIGLAGPNKSLGLLGLDVYPFWALNKKRLTSNAVENSNGILFPAFLWRGGGRDAFR